VKWEGRTDIFPSHFERFSGFAGVESAAGQA
jgi:hypothetical protein